MQCIICDEAVTNPICVECLGREMEVWLSETNPKLIKDVKDIVRYYELMNPISKCVLCGKDMGVCRHCFTKEVFDLIKQHSPKLEEEFIRQFNYELTGY